MPLHNFITSITAATMIEFLSLVVLI